MFLRISKVKRSEKVYEYGQLVQSYRRESDGLPQHRVVANLGKLNETEIANLRAALKASKAQIRVVLPEQATPVVERNVVTHNLAYLDLAVLDGLWRQWQLDTLLGELLPQGDAEVRPVDVVEALVLQRCVVGGSKLFAERWFPTTALPELLQITPQQFNNTRLHRVLEALEAIDGQLQEKLARHQHRQERFSNLFVDVTDTWFEGRGPELAQQRQTKEGLWRYKVGIVLLCDAQGRPLRWKTVAGRVADNRSIIDLIDQVDQQPWIANTPLVVDRALGTTASMTELHARKIRFVTALRRTEFLNYSDEIPWQPFLEIELGDEHLEQQVDRVSRLALKAGLQRVSDTLYVKDLGLLTHNRAPRVVPTQFEPKGDDPLQKALRTARQLRAGLDSGQFANQRNAAAHFGRTQTWLQKRLKLLTLPCFIQDDIERGGARGLSQASLLKLTSCTVDEAASRYTQLKAKSTRKIRRYTRPRPQPSQVSERLQIRGVLYFNPYLLIDKRRKAQAQLEGIYAYVDQLNTNTRRALRKPSLQSLMGRIHNRLRKESLTDAFDIKVTGDNGPPQLELILRSDAWNRRRRFDGFSLVAAHPKLEYAADELACLYRNKDAIEKDFQTIKSVLELRPVWHRTDAKVRAHVTICMLALLLERTLRTRLSPAAISANTALELLHTCHLNRLDTARSATPLYTITRPNTDQTRILEILGMSHLVDDEELNSTIWPRDD